MKLVVYFVWLAGFCLLLGLVGYQGFSDVTGALWVAGWGVAGVVAFHVIPLLADTICWWYLFDVAERPSFRLLFWARWIGESVNDLLPVAQVGGPYVRARLLSQRGLPGARTGATVVVDLTLGLLSQVVFAVLGLLLLLLFSYQRNVVLAVVIGLCLSVLMVGGFLWAQQKGLFGAFLRSVARVRGEGEWMALVGSASALDEAIRDLYRRRGVLLLGGFWRLMGWLLGAGEVWLALHFLHAPVSLVTAVMLESLGRAVRSAAFVVPGALGVQEGGFLLLGGFVGLPGDVAIALSLLKRARELALGLPGLIAWQWAEGQHLLSRRSAQQQLVSPEER